MKERGCGQTMEGGHTCTTADESVPPMLCEDCLTELVASLEMAEMYGAHYERAWADAARRAKTWAAVNVLLCVAIMTIMITAALLLSN